MLSLDYSHEWDCLFTDGAGRMQVSKQLSAITLFVITMTAISYAVVALFLFLGGLSG